MPAQRPFRTALLATLLAACGSDPTALQEPNRFVGLIDAQPWEGGASATLVLGGGSGDTLYVFGYRPHGQGSSFAEVAVSARIAPLRGPGRYTLTGNAASLTELVGGDGVVGRYESTGAQAGTVILETYDGSTGSAGGSLEFTARRTGASGGYGDEVSVSGSFRAAVQCPRCGPLR